MAIIIRSVTNNTPYTLTLKVPSLEENLLPVTVSSSATLDLLSVVTEDDLIAMQLYLNGMVDRGSLTVAATIDTSSFEQGYEGGNSLIGVISNDATQLTTSWNFLNFENASNSEIFFKTVGGSGVNGHVGWDTANTYVDSSTGVQILTNEFGFTPYNWLFSSTGILSTPGAIGINTSTPDVTAALDITSTTQGFLPPRMTTVQRNAISSPAEGLIVYNLDTHQAELWNGTSWVILG